MKDMLKDYYRSLNVDEKVFEYCNSVEEKLKDRFAAIDAVSEINQLKVLKAMQDNRLSEAHFAGSSGYGYTDDGRDALERIYADVFHTEDALVRTQIVCGTHALCTAMFGNLRPGDEILAIAGKPYDTLDEIIGIRESRGSLAEYGVTYAQVDLLPNGNFDIDGIKNAINSRTRLVEIQRSKGYAVRKTLSVQQIGEAIKAVKSVNPDIICMVDNCYGEFVQDIEPSDVGADLVVGSLIKNPGGGLAPIGGYICGKKEYVRMLHTDSRLRDSARRLEPHLAIQRLSLRDFSWHLQLLQVRLRVRYLQQMYTRDWALRLFLTAQRTDTILFRLLSFRLLRGSWHSVKESRLQRRLTVM